MKLLVLTAGYPSLDGKHEQMFVHVRNMYYVKKGYDVTVLNFGCNCDYCIDGIKVIALESYKKFQEEYDLCLSHASNVRNHYLFLWKYEKKFKRIIFFFHGHEVLRLNEAYPSPYPYIKKNSVLAYVMQDIYDSFKIYLWKRFYKKLAYKSKFVFVSNWILNNFKNNFKIYDAEFLSRCYVINNSIGEIFEREEYNYKQEKKYGFITIRSYLDGSKYGVDLVMKLAENNPEEKFLLIGRGRFFDYNKKPDNVTWINETLNHSEMIHYLNDSRCGLLLTREDTQGVMTCELAAFGMPVITSDIEVCHEFFEDMPNVALIDNSDEFSDIIKIRSELERKCPYVKDRTYFACNTISKEVVLFHEDR